MQQSKEARKKDKQPWYAVKSIFYHHLPNKYEERIVLFKATGFEDAETKAEQESKVYAQTLDDVDYIEWVDIFHLFDENVGDKVEVYSRLTASDLQPTQYIQEKYYDKHTA